MRGDLDRANRGNALSPTGKFLRVGIIAVVDDQGRRKALRRAFVLHENSFTFRRPGKNGGYPNFASDVSCVPGCRGDSVARHSSFETWSRLGVGDSLRGSHLDQPKYRYPLSPRFFPVSFNCNRQRAQSSRDKKCLSSAGPSPT
jgi:hypothetical protein